MEGKDEYMYSTCKFYYLEKELHPITVQYEGNYTRLQYEGNLLYAPNVVKGMRGTRL